MNNILVFLKMLKAKTKHESASLKRNKVSRTLKKRSHQQTDATQKKSKGKLRQCLFTFGECFGSVYEFDSCFSVKVKKSLKHTSQSSKPAVSPTNNSETMTAFEYYVQCRAKNEELRKKRISSRMRGPISKKRMRALHALKSRTKRSSKTRLNLCHVY